jgi:tripartite-type tricarboxylate transporter receptor subunit TctC
MTMLESSFVKKATFWLANWLGYAALVFCCLVTGTAFSQEYPARPVRMLVGFGPGGVSDVHARVVAQAVSESLHQQVVIENLPGAGSTVATVTAAKARPDGYTLLWFGSGQLVTASLFKSPPYDLLREFVPIVAVGYSNVALLVTPKLQVKSVSDVVALAKADQSKFNIGVTTIGGLAHLNAELFKSMTGLNDVTMVPYKTTGPLIAAVKSNDIQVIFEFLTPVLSDIKNGALRALGVTSSHRFRGLPDVPTLSEAGVNGYDMATWAGVAAPAKTTRAIVDRLNKAFNVALAKPEVMQRDLELGIDPIGGTPEDLGKMLVADAAKWRMIIEEAKIEKH